MCDLGRGGVQGMAGGCGRLLRPRIGKVGLLGWIRRHVAVWKLAVSLLVVGMYGHRHVVVKGMQSIKRDRGRWDGIVKEGVGQAGCGWSRASAEYVGGGGISDP